MKMKTVNDMYLYSNTQAHPALLSNYGADFWEEYRNNAARYDKIFRRTFLSFKYFLQESGEDISEITQNFTEDVYNHLMMNDKKYSELYRIHVVDDEDYSLLNNYNVTEKMDKDTSSNDTNTYGSRSDSGSDTRGAQSNSRTNTVAPYNTNSFQNDNKSDESIGQRMDSNSYTKGQQQDTLSNTGTEDYTLTRVGNIGIMTGTDMLQKHNNYWKVYEFYQMIFRDISRELLIL